MALTKIPSSLIEQANQSITSNMIEDTLDLTSKTVSVATATAGDNDTTVASTAFVASALAALVDSSPTTLDTLNELAAALGDDPNFATTTATSLGLKAPLASPNFTGAATFGGDVAVSGANPANSLLAQLSVKSTAALANGNASGISFWAQTSSGLGAYGSIQAVTTGDYAGKLVFTTRNGAGVFDPRMTLDASGNLLVGNTVVNPASGFATQRGFGYAASTGKVEIATTANDAVMELGKNTATDGSILVFRKQGTVVGSIGVDYSTEFYMGGGGGGFYINPASIRPTTGGNSNTLSDNTHDFGSGSHRFKDLYLSGNIALTTADNASAANMFVSPSTDFLYLEHPANGMIFRNTSGAERMRIDSSGNLLVGTASNSVYNDVSGTGIALNAGQIQIAGTGTPLYANRQGSNGDIIDLRRDGAVVGSIGTYNGVPYIGYAGGAGGGIMFNGQSIEPTALGSSRTSGASDIGSSTYKWKDLYLAGNAKASNLQLFEGTTQTGGVFKEKDLLGAGTSTATSIFSETGSGIKFFVNGSVPEVATIDTSGRVGIGTSSPNARLHTNLAVVGSLLPYLNGTTNTFDTSKNIIVTHDSAAIGLDTAAGLLLVNNNNSNNAISPVIAFSAKSASNSYNHTYAAIWGEKTATGVDSNWNQGSLVFATTNAAGPSERMRIDASGNLSITGNVTAPSVYANVTGSQPNVFILPNGLLIRSASSLRYKNTVNDATHGLAELLTLRPVTYKGNNDGDTIFGGLIAEEVHDAGLTEFVQYSEEGEPDGLGYGSMVSLCIKAIQEQQTIIQEQQALTAALTARVEELENK